MCLMSTNPSQIVLAFKDVVTMTKVTFPGQKRLTTHDG
jgi:hypothetical protein